MKIAGIYSFNNGKRIVESKYEMELHEITQAIALVDSKAHKTKTSKEKTMPGKTLYKPRSLNTAFDVEFESRGWEKRRVPCEYPTEFYAHDYKPTSSSKGAFRGCLEIHHKGTKTQRFAARPQEFVLFFEPLCLRG